MADPRRTNEDLSMDGTIIIIGGGIGGLTTALSHHAAGFQVEVYESVPEL